MPTNIYTVEIDGTEYDIEGDRPPNEQEARAAVSAHVQTPDFSDVESGTSSAPPVPDRESINRLRVGRGGTLPDPEKSAEAVPYVAAALPLAYSAGALGPAVAAKEALRSLLGSGAGAITGAGIGAATDYMGITRGYGKGVGSTIGGVIGGVSPSTVGTLVKKLPFGRYTAIPKLLGSKLGGKLTTEELEAQAAKNIFSNPQLSQAVPERAPNISMNAGDAPIASSGSRELAEKLVTQGAAKNVDEAIDYVSRATPQQLKMLEEVAARPVSNYVERSQNPAFNEQVADDAVAAAKARISLPPPTPPVDQVAEARLAARKALGESRIGASAGNPLPEVEPVGTNPNNEFARATARRRVAEEAANRAKAETSRIAAEGAADVAPNGPIERAKVAVAAKKALSPDLLPDEDIRKLSMEWKTNTATRDFIRQELMQRFPDNWRDIVAQLKRGGSKF